MKERLPRGTLHLYAAGARRLLRSYAPLLGEVPPDARVLDLGCGPGHVAARLVQMQPSMHVVAADIDPAMLRLARRRHPPSSRLRYELADAAGMPFEDGAFDLVWASAVFHHVAHVSAALRECLRVLGHGGELWVVEARPEMTRADFRAAAGVPALPGLFGLARGMARVHGMGEGRQRLLAQASLAAGFDRAEATTHGAWTRLRAVTPADAS